MQRLYAITFKPSWSWTVAATGQTFSHGGVSPIWRILAPATQPRAGATVIRHHLQTFLVVDGRRHRADVFARCRLAHLAHHRLVDRLHVVNPLRKLLVLVGLVDVRLHRENARVIDRKSTR